MADKTTAQLLDALRRAATEPGGAYLLAGKGVPGLFAANPAGRLAAQRCVEEGYLRLLRTENRGKSPQEVYTVSDRGLAYLLEQGNPRELLEDLVRALEARETQIAELLTLVRDWLAGMGNLRSVAATALQAATNNGPTAAVSPLTDAVLGCLAAWHTSDASEDCPLPELYRRLPSATSLGQFHDALRKLYQKDRIYLHPWTGPLYSLPEPACALLVGHEIAYYASMRQGA